ncbi:hypothetical protein CR513_28633, partial [Mucuna pruriens]
MSIILYSSHRLPNEDPRVLAIKAFFPFLLGQRPNYISSLPNMHDALFLPKDDMPYQKLSDKGTFLTMFGKLSYEPKEYPLATDSNLLIKHLGLSISLGVISDNHFMHHPILQKQGGHCLIVEMTPLVTNESFRHTKPAKNIGSNKIYNNFSIISFGGLSLHPFANIINKWDKPIFHHPLQSYPILTRLFNALPYILQHLCPPHYGIITKFKSDKPYNHSSMEAISGAIELQMGLYWLAFRAYPGQPSPSRPAKIESFSPSRDRVLLAQLRSSPSHLAETESFSPNQDNTRTTESTLCQLSPLRYVSTTLSLTPQFFHSPEPLKPPYKTAVPRLNPKEKRVTILSKSTHVDAIRGPLSINPKNHGTFHTIKSTIKGVSEEKKVPRSTQRMLKTTIWIQFQLGVMDLDLTLVMDEKPLAIMKTSTDADKSLLEAWERSNMLSLNLIRLTMVANVKTFMPKTNDDREFMKLVKEYSQSSITDKSIVGNLSSELTKKIDWSQPIHDHVIEMSSMVAKLKSIGMEIILNSLPIEFGQFQVNITPLKKNGTFRKLRPC